MKNNVILCVDDEKIILDSVKTQLKNNFGNKYILETAQNGLDALEIIEELQADGINVLVIISDWLMPQMRGDEFLIAAHKKFPRIVKIMLTGQADDKAIKNAMANANLLCCLSKPWKEQELVNAVKKALS
jgi:CheY-like chemotaxis protein